MRIALCQFNAFIGHISYNKQRILEQTKQAAQRGAQLAIFPELAICGYPPRDLLLRDDFHQQIGTTLKELSHQTPISILLGAPIGKHNTAVLCAHGEFHVVARKTLLPNYGVFNEQRYFVPGNQNDGDNLLRFPDLTLGISICEDIWNDKEFWPNPLYNVDPIESISHADIIVNLSASPFTAHKPQLRESLLRHTARRHKKTILMVGQVGANDHLIFDGASCVVDPNGNVLMRHGLFQEGTLIFDTESTNSQAQAEPISNEIDLIIDAISLSIKDYVQKSGANGVIIGLSGGIDSAVTAALAVRALGANAVIGVRMPSQYSSSHSLNDAAELASLLDISITDIPIEPIVDSFRSEILSEKSKSTASQVDICDQNLQARVRGTVLMSLSNLTGKLVLSTGNKSELAMGYATLYGDMCGALAPLGDIYKTQVYDIARRLNEIKPTIPKNSIIKAPSAELKANQTDQDSLPAYELLDAVLERYIEKDMNIVQIQQETNMTIEKLSQIIQTIHRNEYKRKQSGIIPMASIRQFGDSRKWPIAHFFDPIGCQV